LRHEITKAFAENSCISIEYEIKNVRVEKFAPMERTELTGVNFPVTFGELNYKGRK